MESKTFTTVPCQQPVNFRQQDTDLTCDKSSTDGFGTLISVVVPIYNVEAYVRECLTSIERQTFSDYEVIIVDDGATDSSAIIAQEFVIKHTNWQIIHKENGGLSSARNVGIEHAKGMYICFVDSDDFITPDYLEALYRSAILYDADMVIADYHEVDMMGSATDKDKGTQLYEQGIVAKDDILNALTYKGECHYATAVVVAWNKLVKTDIMKMFRYTEGILHEDEDIIMPLLLACDKVVWMVSDLYAYRQRENSIMHDEKQAFRHLKVLDVYEKRIHIAKSLGNEQLFGKLKSTYFTDICIWNCLIRKDFGIPWYKVHGLFCQRMFWALCRYGDVLGMRRWIKYVIFVISPEYYLKRFYI